MTDTQTKKKARWPGCLLKLMLTAFGVSVLGCAGIGIGYFNGIYTPPTGANVPLAIRGGTLYDGTDAAPRKGSVIVIEK